MAIKFERSPYADEAGSTRRRWPSRERTPAMTRDAIRRDAAARLGVPVDLLEKSAGTTPEAPTAQAAHHTRRRRGSVVHWLRDLVSPEPAGARRQRLEAEAEAELGLSAQHQPERPVG